MKIKRSKLQEMVKRAIRERLHELSEADKKRSLDDAEDDNAAKEDPQKPPAQGGRGEKDDGKKPKKDEPAPEPPPEEPDEDDDQPDVAAAPEGPDGDDDEGGTPKSKVADEVTSKTIQSITLEPKSKILPGAKEIVLTFREIQDPLRILVTKTGEVRFYFKGLHNSL